MTKKWDLFDRYNEQQRKSGEAIARYYKRIAEAKENVVKARSEYEDLLRREALDGIDLTDEKAAARKALAEAQEAVEIAEKEAVEANRIIREVNTDDRIDIPELIRDFNGSYRNAVRSNEMEPIVKRIEAARSEYLNALLDFYELKEEYRPLETEFNELCHRYYRNRAGVQLGRVGLLSHAQIKFITVKDIEKAKLRKLPEDVKRITPKKDGSKS
jgi:hypothetical protein